VSCRGVRVKKVYLNIGEAIRADLDHEIHGTFPCVCRCAFVCVCVCVWLQEHIMSCKRIIERRSKSSLDRNK
jgi:hypothetical protein